MTLRAKTLYSVPLQYNMLLPERFFEIDFAKGIAVVLMVLFHFLFDLNYFSGMHFNLSSGLWLFVGRASAAIFLLFVGVNLTISDSRAQQGGMSCGKRLAKFLRRGAKTILLGLAITIVTLLLFPPETIWFGVLHLIGVSVILAFPFLAWKKGAIALGAVVIALGLFLWGLSFPFPWLLPLGFQPTGFASFDYFPIFPSFGVILLGIAAGNTFYPSAKRAFFISLRGNSTAAWLFSFLGRHSLAIYFLHQPLLVGLLLAL